MSSHGYKKYMKKEAQQANPLVKIFFVSFVCMLFFFTFLIKSFSPNVDTSIGDYKEITPIEDEEISKKIVDNSLEEIQREDMGTNFSDIMRKAEEVQKETVQTVQNNVIEEVKLEKPKEEKPAAPANDAIYKVFIGTYSSAEQAKVAKDIIQESGNGLSPIVKCIGANNYTLQVGIFKTKQSAETLLNTILQNNLPGRIVQE